MNDVQPPAPRRQTPRRLQTPRIPSNVLYNRIVPIAIGVLVIVLVIVIGAVILGAGSGY
jgi:hypothetical protein